MKQYQSQKLGLIEYHPEDVLHFASGLFGFEGLKQYILIDGDTNTYFKYLQSLEDPGVTFVVCDPTSLIENYQLIIDKNDVMDLFDGKNVLETDLAHVVIVTVPSSYEEVSVNLLGPVVINVKNRKAKQVVSKCETYTTKHYLFKQKQQEPTQSVKKIG